MRLLLQRVFFWFVERICEVEMGVEGWEWECGEARGGRCHLGWVWPQSALWPIMSSKSRLCLCGMMQYFLA